jgi:uncharacterized protein (UPF0332 family)/predicted nucleotidyltransferase
MTQAAIRETSALHAWHVIEEFRRMLRNAFASDFRGMILYGSYARGDYHEDSDIDLIVLFKDGDTAKKASSRVSEIARELPSEHGALVMPMTMGELDYQKGKSPLFLNVKREGILILAEERFEMEPEIERLLELAHDSLDAARELFESRSEFYGFAASRAYYAMFYAVEAALLSKGLSYSRHTGVIGGFNQHFIRTGIFPIEFHKLLQDAFELRQLGDYGTEPFPREKAESILQDAETFVKAVEEYLHTTTEA